MSLASIERLERGYAALVAALAADNRPGIEAATSEIGAATAGLKAVTNWSSALRERLVALRSQGNAARRQLNVLTDRSRRRGEMVDALRGTATAAYGRTGR